jgi:hypothetical protein
MARNNSSEASADQRMMAIRWPLRSAQAPQRIGITERVRPMRAKARPICAALNPRACR